MKTILPIVFGVLLILFITFDDNSIRFVTCDKTIVRRYDVSEKFFKE